MKIKILLICLCLLTIFTPSSLFAQRGGIYIGKLDLYAVTLLHPSMIWYSPEKKAFKVSRDAVSKHKIATENKENSEERRKLEAKMKSLKARIKEEEERYNKAVQTYTHKYMDSIDEVGTATAELNRVKFKKYTEEASVNYHVKVNSYYGEYTLCEDKLSKLSSTLDDNYTSPEETEKRFIEIINEVKAYAKRVADSKGITIVLNSGYKRLLSNNNRNSVLHENSFSNIFSTAFPTNLLNDEAAIRGYYLGIESTVENWLDNGSSLFGDIGAKALFNEEIIVGGVDLTADVLSSLYRNYKIDSNISNAIIKGLKK